MSNQVIVVTSPDDVQNDGLRLLLVDLTPDQTQIISDALTQMIELPTVITYVWNSSENFDWMVGKKHKSDIIIFNADSDNDILVGYMAAQLNSYYFGILKLLGKVNNSAIYTTEQLINILEKVKEQHGRLR